MLKKLGMKQSMADTSLWYRMDRMMVTYYILWCGGSIKYFEVFL